MPGPYNTMIPAQPLSGPYSTMIPAQPTQDPTTRCCRSSRLRALALDADVYANQHRMLTPITPPECVPENPQSVPQPERRRSRAHGLRQATKHQ